MAGAVLPGFFFEATKFGGFSKYPAHSGTEPEESESGTSEQTKMSPTTTEEDDEPDNIRKRGPKSRYFPCEEKLTKLKTPKKGRKRAMVEDHVKSECITSSPTTSNPEYSQLFDAVKTDFSDAQGTSASGRYLDKYNRHSTWDPFTEFEPDTTDPAYISQQKDGIDLDDDMTGDLRYDTVLKLIRKNGANGRTIPLRETARKHLVRESDAYDVGFFLREFGAAKCVDDAHSGYITLNQDFDWVSLDARRKHEAAMAKYDETDFMLDTHMEWAQKTLESLKNEYPYSYITKDDLDLKSNSIILAKTYDAKHKVTDSKLEVTNAKNVVKVEGPDLFNVRWPIEAVTEIDKIRKRNAAIAIDKQNDFKKPERSSSTSQDLTENDISILRSVLDQPNFQTNDGRSMVELLLQKGVDPDFLSMVTLIPKEELVESSKKKLSKEEALEKRRQSQRERAKIKRDEAKKKREEGLKNKRTKYYSTSSSVHLDVVRLHADSSSLKSISSPEYPPSLSDSHENANLDFGDDTLTCGNAMLHHEDGMIHYDDEMFSYGDNTNLHWESVIVEGEEVPVEGGKVFVQGEEVLMEEIFTEGEDVFFPEDGIIHHGDKIGVQREEEILQEGGMFSPKHELLSLTGEVLSSGDKVLHHDEYIHRNVDDVLRMVDESIEDKNVDYAGEWVNEQNFDNVSPLASPNGVMLSPSKFDLVSDRSCLSIGAELNNSGLQKTPKMLSPIKSPTVPNGTVKSQTDVNNDVGSVKNDKKESDPGTPTDIFNCFVPEDYQRIALGNDKFTPDAFDQYLRNSGENQFDMKTLFGSPGKTKIDENFNPTRENYDIFKQETRIDFSSVLNYLKT